MTPVFVYLSPTIGDYIDKIDTKERLFLAFLASLLDKAMDWLTILNKIFLSVRNITQAT